MTVTEKWNIRTRCLKLLSPRLIPQLYVYNIYIAGTQLN